MTHREAKVGMHVTGRNPNMSALWGGWISGEIVSITNLETVCVYEEHTKLWRHVDPEWLTEWKPKVANE